MPLTIGWATDALDHVRRQEWNHLRRTGGAKTAKEFKGLRWMLLRNWENLTSAQTLILQPGRPTAVRAPRLSLSSPR